MDVIALQAPDGTLTYQVETGTPDEYAALEAADDANSWCAANATVVSTIQVQNPTAGTDPEAGGGEDPT